MAIFLWLIALLWLVGTSWRIYKQARFYQIEEYKNDRYLLWLSRGRTRWLPNRPLIFVVVGAILGFFTDSVPGQTSIMPYIFALITGIIAIWPPNEGEIKKPFRRTDRATRILAAAFAIALLNAIWFFGLHLANFPLPESDRFIAIIYSAAGLLIFLLAPLHLMLGNALMQPVERRIQQNYMQQARATLDVINPRIVGITGSYGKTTTKHFVRDLLSVRYKTYATPKSYNTEMGVTLAINRDLADDYSVQYFVVEMGMYTMGEIAAICRLTPPHISMVIEVGPQHLERAGSIDNIARAKYEIIQGLAPDGLGIFNWDNEYVRAMYERGYPDNRIAISRTLTPAQATEKGVRFVASDIQETLDGLTFLLTDTHTNESEAVFTPVVGVHNVTNLLLATAVAVHEGITLRDIAFRMRTLTPAESRLVRQVSDAGITIINDAYSANPVGAISALRVLGMHAKGKRLLVTPGMIELGEMQEQANYQLGQAAAQHATDIILVGSKQTAPIREGVLSTDFPPARLQVVETLTEAVNWYQQHLQAGDAVLFLNDLPDTY